MTDEELKPFLSGSLGVPGLDLARALVSTRAELLTSQEQLATAVAAGDRYAAVAEMAIGEASQAKDQLKQLREALLAAAAGISTEETGDG